jgi:ADP-dependent NAD(P)H-hydrate dehydratase / NAD(P)H-hydrate epimerase
MKIVTAAEMRAIDRATSASFGVPSLALMENAGTAVAEYVVAEHGSARRIVVFCGKGNNGGDGFVVARRLHQQGKNVQVLLLADPAELRGDALSMFLKLPAAALIVKAAAEFDTERVKSALDADLYVDAILGTGFRPPLSELYATAINLMNRSSAAVIAVDIPSGADADARGGQSGAVARADAVVTFTAPRPAHVFASLTSGPTLVAAIGSPAEAIVSAQQLNLITARDIAPLIGPRAADSNKGNYGHVLVIGGALGKAGAPAMVSMAVLRMGAGLVTAAIPKSVLATVAGFHPEVMTELLAETDAGTISARALADGLGDLVKGKSVIALGPGISRNPQTSQFVRAFVAENRLPMVLDADGLNAFEGHTAELDGTDHFLVITPHPGEMARLAGCTIAEVQKDRLGVARRFAREHNLIVVLKGYRTLVAKPDGEAWVNTTGNPGMSTGGTGDILTGMIAGMMAQHSRNLLVAVLAAVHLHGSAGDVMRESVGELPLVATDLLQGLPEGLRRTRRDAEGKIVRWDG